MGKKKLLANYLTQMKRLNTQELFQEIAVINILKMLINSGYYLLQKFDFIFGYSFKSHR